MGSLTPSFLMLSFIAVAEALTIGIPLTRHLLGSGPDDQDWTIQFWLKWARQQNQIPRALAMYGMDDDPRYAVAFEPNTGNVLWNADGLHETAAEYQARYDAQWHHDGRKLIFARAYTFAEAGYPLATPTTYFRVASCAKTLTAVLLLRLLQEGKLTLGTKLQSVLNLKTPSGDPPKDPRFGDITVRHLLSHQSGLQSWFAPRDVAAAFGVSFPVSKSQTASFAASVNLAFTPGSQFSYSNMGYVLLGMIAEKKLGVSYLTALRNKVFAPLGASRVRRFPLLPETQPASEAKYDSIVLGVGRSVVTGDGRIVPLVYGGDFDSRVWDAGGGLSVAAPDFAKVLASLNVRANNPVLDATRIDLLLNNSFGFDGVQGSPRQAWKGGAIWGLSSTLNFVDQGISYVVCFGKNEVGGAFYPDFPALRSAIAATSWPS